MAADSHELTLIITADKRASMDREIDEAVAVALDHALRERRRGILVTRHGPTAFTVGLSDDVPFGLTREYQAW
jgi:hypothetical protein